MTPTVKWALFAEPVAKPGSLGLMFLADILELCTKKFLLLKSLKVHDFVQQNPL
jgi:hypothetical protein